ncbi:hypothetical protein QWA68_015437 [Fusarium oxysporum]|nr:hypothetical protein QWA68_015437 [Fusarium oxysporum]
MAITDDKIPDEEVIKPEFINQMLLNTIFRNRCFLAGDAAHLTNPIGGLGLCTGMLDADALAQALDLALNRFSCEPEAQEECFKAYSSARRQVFQTVIYPTSSAAKTRLQCGNPDDIAKED